MFEHLDDPADVASDPDALARVMQRAGAIRRRRIGAAIAIAGCIILIGGATGFLVSRPSGVRLSSAETAFQFNSLKGTLPVGTPVPTTALVNVVFAGARDGDGLAAHLGQAVLAATADGGSTWQVRDGHLPPGYGQGAGYPGQFEFIGSTGYLWGGASTADGRAPLWITHDGGAAWHAASIGPVVHDVSVIGSNVWALTSTCPVTSGAGSSSDQTATCPLVAEESDDSGTTWVTPDGSGITPLPAAPTAGERVELARITLSRAYVLAAASAAAATTATTASQSGQDTGLVYTDDAGVTWQTRAVPCAGAFDLGAEIAASGTDDLWLLCGGQASAGSQPKELFRSGDGGLTWALTASATASGTQLNLLPLSGYIAPFSVGHKNLAVASATTAWLYPSRVAMFRTGTGGRSWTAVPGLDTAGFGSGGAGNVTFISATQGWICAYGVGLWHTSDGVHWFPLGV